MRWGEKGYPELHKTEQSFRMVSAHPCCSLISQTELCLKCSVGCPRILHLGGSLFNSGSPSVSSFFCICIPNKQEIVFICMQMCLSPRLGFWIKSFTVPLIPNYTQALTWAPPPGRGVSDLPSKRISVSLGCLVCHLRNWVGIWI